MISLQSHGTRKRCRAVRRRWAVASTTPAQSVGAWTAGRTRNHPAIPRPGATLSSQGLRTWCSPSGMKGTPIPGEELGVPRSGCLAVDGRAARRRARRHVQDEGPRFLRTGLRSMPIDLKVARQDAAFSRVAEHDTRPWTWPDPIDAGYP